MIKYVYFILSVLICVFIVIALFTKTNHSSSVNINGKLFEVDIARTNTQKEKGLNIYTKLPLDKGMLFPFEKSGLYSFWMKGMKFPIDIIYIQNGKITEIYPNLPFPKNSNEKPIIITPNKNADYVLEINAGLSSKYNFKIGDKVTIKI